MKIEVLFLPLLLLGGMVAAHAADPAAGEQKAQTVCAACHGPAGISTNPLWPNIAGQHEAYIVKAIGDYKSGARNDPLMSPISQMLSDEDIANLAAYFAAKK